MAGNPVASINAQLSLDSAQFSSGMGRARQELKAFGVSLNGLPKTWGRGVSAGLSAAGAAGVAASVGIGLAAAGFGLLMEKGRQALEFADGIGDTATKIGVTTDTLQEYRYAIHAAGGETADADEALAALTRSLGAAESNLSPKLMKAFAALGFTPEQLKSFPTADAALRVVMDRISKLGSAAEQAAVADKLGLTPLLPLARQGAGALDELAAKAHALGYVMDADLIAKAGDANDKLEDLHQVISVQLNTALVQSAPLLLSMAGGLVEVAKQARAAADWVGRVQVAGLRTKISNLDRQIDTVQKGRFGTGDFMGDLDLVAGLTGKGGRAGYLKMMQAERAKAAAQLADATRAPEPPKAPGPSPGGTSLRVPGKEAAAGGGAAKSKPSRTVEQINDELALEAARARGDAAEEERLKNRLDLQKRIKEYQEAGLKPAAAQAAAQAAIATLQQAQAVMREREIAKLQAAVDLEVARASDDSDRVRALEQQADLQSRIDGYVDKGVTQEEARTRAKADQVRVLAAEGVARDKALADDRRSLEIQAAEMAGDVALQRSLEAQRDLQQRIDFYVGQRLDKAVAERRAQEDMLRLDQARAEAARRWASDDTLERRIAQAQARGDDTHDLERERSIRQRFDEYASKTGVSDESTLFSAVGDVDDDAKAKLQGVFRSSFHDGVRAALDGDFGSFVQDWWKDRLSNALGKAFDSVADSLANAFSGASKGSGGLGGLLSSAAGALFGSFGGKHAGGGSFMVGGAGGVDANLVTMALTRGERVDITPANDAGPAGSVFAPLTFSIDARGADREGLARVERQLQQMQRELPGKIVSVSNDAHRRGAIRAGRG